MSNMSTIMTKRYQRRQVEKSGILFWSVIFLYCSFSSLRSRLGGRSNLCFDYQPVVRDSGCFVPRSDVYFLTSNLCFVPHPVMLNSGCFVPRSDVYFLDPPPVIIPPAKSPKASPIIRPILTFLIKNPIANPINRMVIMLIRFLCCIQHYLFFGKAIRLANMR